MKPTGTSTQVGPSSDSALAALEGSLTLSSKSSLTAATSPKELIIWHNPLTSFRYEPCEIVCSAPLVKIGPTEDTRPVNSPADLPYEVLTYQVQLEILSVLESNTISGTVLNETKTPLTVLISVDPTGIENLKEMGSAIAQKIASQYPSPEHIHSIAVIDITPVQSYSLVI